jgi:multidrug efflux pump subunit AcrA (membrane-fusion protein)
MIRTKTLLTAVILLVVVGSLFGCSPSPVDTETPEEQVIAVQRGDLSVYITAAGNLALSHTEDLAFEVAGTVEEVLVEEGDNVDERQVLARLDTSEYEDNLELLQEIIETAEDQLTAAQRQLAAEQNNLLQAEINLRNNQITLAKVDGTFEWPDPDYETPLESSEAELNDAEHLLRLAKKYDDGTPKWDDLQRLAQEGVSAAQSRLNTLQAESEEEIAVAAIQVELSQARFEDAQQAVKDAEEGVWEAQQEVDEAQEELNEALATSLEIIALFDGFITRVNVEGGDEVTKGTLAVQLADPTEFEAELLVNEMDILQVALGGEATVQVDALQGAVLPAEVTHISPTATIQSGVVNYRIKVEVKSLEAMAQEHQQAIEAAPQQGELPEPLQQAIKEGRISREQAEEMAEQMQPGQSGQRGQVSTAIPEDFQLREGLTVTVNILVDARDDVLLIPNSAITSQGGQPFVSVVSPDGTIEERAIQIGISDYLFTEVLGGLSEGEQMAVPQGTATVPATQQNQQRGMFSFSGGRH